MRGNQKRVRGPFRGRQGLQEQQRCCGVGLGQGALEQAEPRSHPEGRVICAPRQRLSCLSGLPSIVAPCQPGSATQLIPAATATCPGHFLC